MKLYSHIVNETYKRIRSLYIPKEAINENGLEPGQISVLIEDDESFSIEGNLTKGGILTGLSKLYSYLPLDDGVDFEFSVTEDKAILILSPKHEVLPPSSEPVESTTVFEKLALKHIHIEPFRPQNLETWVPETETDVYLVFGVLQEFTDYQYCCGASKAILTRLGASYELKAKPDAILINRATGQYLMAEWKKRSSEFKLNHKPEDVDVLVCWNHDENNKELLPPNILALQSVAKEVAQNIFV